MVSDLKKGQNVDKFDKEAFKRDVEVTARKLYRRSLEDLNDKEAFHAVAYAVEDLIIDDWMATQKAAGAGL